MSSSSTRPCGPLDNRTRTRRCVPCQRLHVKCQGGRPCNSCRQRLLVCSETPAKSAGLIIMNVTPTVSNDSALNKPVYIEVCLKALTCPNYLGMFECLSRESIGSALSHEAIFHVVNAIGAVYQGRQSTINDERNIRIGDARRSYHAAKLSLTKLVDEPIPSQTDAVLLSSLLLAAFELMVDRTAIRWYLFMRQKLSPLVRNQGPGFFKGAMANSIFKLYQVFEISYAFSFDEDTFLADDAWMDHFPGVMQHPIMHQPEQCEERLFQYMMELAARVARLNFRCRGWLEQRATTAETARDLSPAMVFPRDSANPTPRESQTEGYAIVHYGLSIGTHLANIQPQLPIYEAYRKSGPSLLTVASYHCIVISLSRLFIDPAWTTTASDLPILSEAALLSHALAALDLVESGMQSEGLSAVVFLPLLTCISLEVRSINERQRIIRLYNATAAKGFAVSLTVAHDITLAWEAIKG